MPRRKIRFIEPQGREGRPFNVWVSRWPLLGPIILATLLEKLGYDVSVYNENISGSLLDNPDALADVSSADVIGLSIMTPTAARGYLLADTLRKHAPQATIAFGGSHATFCPEEAAAHGDVVVRGEGERIIDDLAAGRIRHGIVCPEAPQNLDEIPALNHALLHDFNKLVALNRGVERYQLPVLASRGCPHNCTYCSVTRMFGRHVRRQSPQKVRQDLETYAHRGFRHVFFYDDNFASNREWTKQVLTSLASLRMRFNAQVRIDFPWLDRSRRRSDREMLNLMRQAGGDVMYIGYETIDDATARQWNKGYSGEQRLEERLREDTRLIHDSGLWIHGMFVLSPGDSAETAERVVQFARANQIESMQISLLTPFPGTPLYQQMLPQITLKQYPGDWDYYDGWHCVFGESGDRVRSVHQVLMDAHKQFYRFGGWSLRRVKALLHEPGGWSDKLALLWSNAAAARQTLQLWQRENARFLQMIYSRFRGSTVEAAASLPEGANT